MNCIGCRHWRPVDDQHPIDGFGACERITFCMYSPAPDLDRELAAVVDSNKGHLPLKCKADFGCVLFEEIPQ